MNISAQSSHLPLPVRVRVRLAFAIVAAAAATALLFLAPSQTVWVWLLSLPLYLLSPARTKPPHELTPRDLGLLLAATVFVLAALFLYWHWHGIPYRPPPDSIPPMSLPFRLSLWSVFAGIFAVQLYRTLRRERSRSA